MLKNQVKVWFWRSIFLWGPGLGAPEHHDLRFCRHQSGWVLASSLSFLSSGPPGLFGRRGTGSAPPMPRNVLRSGCSRVLRVTSLEALFDPFMDLPYTMTNYKLQLSVCQKLFFRPISKTSSPSVLGVFGVRGLLEAECTLPCQVSSKEAWHIPCSKAKQLC